jgi:hypothetical protein
MQRENTTIWPARRSVYQADAREWLGRQAAVEGTSVVTARCFGSPAASPGGVAPVVYGDCCQDHGVGAARIGGNILSK